MCPVQLSTMAILKNHCKSHLLNENKSNIMKKPKYCRYVCDCNPTCNASFSLLYSLKSHMKIHRNIIPKAVQNNPIVVNNKKYNGKEEVDSDDICLLKEVKNYDKSDNCINKYNPIQERDAVEYILAVCSKNFD